MNDRCFKLVTADESRAFAFIPGIAMDENGKQQSFIQVLDGKKRTAEYHKFDVKEFFSTLGKFEIEIAENYFSINDILPHWERQRQMQAFGFFLLQEPTAFQVPPALQQHLLQKEIPTCCLQYFLLLHRILGL